MNKTMSLLIPIEAFDNFKETKEFPASDVTPELIRAVKQLDEREELEPFLRSILADFGQTPHGPMEIADIFTHRVTAKGQHGLAAFTLKGKSFPGHSPALQWECHCQLRASLWNRDWSSLPLPLLRMFRRC
jgi:hypothetical protein